MQSEHQQFLSRGRIGPAQANRSTSSLLRLHRNSASFWQPTADPHKVIISQPRADIESWSFFCAGGGPLGDRNHRNSHSLPAYLVLPPRLSPPEVTWRDAVSFHSTPSSFYTFQLRASFQSRERWQLAVPHTFVTSATLDISTSRPTWLVPTYVGAYLPINLHRRQSQL